MSNDDRLFEEFEGIFDHSQTRRKFLRRAIGVGLATPMAMTLLAACGGDDDDDDDDDDSDDDTEGGTDSDGASAEATSTPSDSDASEEPADEPTATSEADEDTDGDAEGNAGGVAVLAEAADPASWDLTKSTWPTWQSVQFLYDTLIGFDDEEQLIPNLAESWEISDDGLDYTLTVREGIPFHDGTMFDAESVRFNIQRHLDLPDSAFYASFEPVESMEVIDERTIQITLSQNRFDFIYILGQWGSVQVSPTAYGTDGAGFAQNPVGTGPFKFDAYEQGSSINLVRNEDYWNGAPLLDGVTIRIIPEPSVRVIEVEAGTLDGVDIEAKDAQLLEDQGITIEQRVTPGAQFISLNLSEPPTNELAVRQAIARAINRDAIIEEVLFGFAEKSRAGVNTDSPYYSDDVSEVEFDPEEATRILEEAGWVMGSNGVREKDGEQLSVSLLSTDFSGWGLYNQIIQDQLGEVGIASEISTLEWNAYLDQWRENQGGWNVTYHSQGSQLASTAAIQASWIPDSFWTITQIDDAADPELVDLATELQSIADEFEITLDIEERKALSVKAQQLFYDHQLTVWLWHAVGSTAINPRLKDYTLSWAGRIIQLDKAWID